MEGTPALRCENSGGPLQLSGASPSGPVAGSTAEVRRLFASHDDFPWLEGWVCLAIVYLLVPGLVVGWAVQPTANMLVTSVLVWWIQMVGVNVGYHRLFAHRSYKTVEPVAMVLAVMGCLSGQGGPIWWAGIHRHHHKHCETVDDFHSPHTSGGSTLGGLIWAHGLYLANYNIGQANKEHNCPDLARKRWLKMLDQYCIVLFLGWAAGCYGCGGTQLLVYGWAVPTFTSWNCEQCINSILHVYGDRPYAITEGDGGCQARNNGWLTFVMLGENWHNNHHAFPWSARQGHDWLREPDLNWCVIWLFGRLGLAWDIKTPTDAQRDARRRPLPQNKEQDESARPF